MASSFLPAPALPWIANARVTTDLQNPTSRTLVGHRVSLGLEGTFSRETWRNGL